MRLQEVYVCFIAGATIRVKLHCFSLSCSLSAFRPHSLWSQAGGSLVLANVSVEKKNTIMYLCNGNKQILTVTNQPILPNRRFVCLYVNTVHFPSIFPNQAGNSVLFMQFTQVKRWSFAGLTPLGLFHHSLYFQDNGVLSNVKLCSANAQWQAHRGSKMI